MNIGLKYTSPFWMTVSMVVPFFLILLIGPLIYLYTRALAGNKIKATDNFHFLPVLIDLIPHIVSLVFLTGWFSEQGFSKEMYDGFEDQYQTYADIPRWISVTFYLFLTWRF